MPDPYWEDIAKRTRDANQRGDNLVPFDGRVREPHPVLQKCVTCGEEFMPQGRRVRCDDCVGERGARSAQSLLERLSDGQKMRERSEDRD